MPRRRRGWLKMAGNVNIEHGWIRAVFAGADVDRCYLAVGNPEPSVEDWQPAYKTTVKGRRMIQMRVPPGLSGVGTRVLWSQINGYVERVAVVVL